MTNHENVQRDERTVAVENTSYRWAFTFVVFALLIDVMYRAAVRDEAAWDLLVLAAVPANICAIYQARQRIFPHGWVWKMTLMSFLAGIVAAVIAIVLAMSKAG